MTRDQVRYCYIFSHSFMSFVNMPAQRSMCWGVATLVCARARCVRVRSGPTRSRPCARHRSLLDRPHDDARLVACDAERAVAFRAGARVHAAASAHGAAVLSDQRFRETRRAEHVTARCAKAIRHGVVVKKTMWSYMKQVSSDTTNFEFFPDFSKSGPPDYGLESAYFSGCDAVGDEQLSIKSTGEYDPVEFRVLSGYIYSPFEDPSKKAREMAAARASKKKASDAGPPAQKKLK